MAESFVISSHFCSALLSNENAVPPLDLFEATHKNIRSAAKDEHRPLD
jgi:hypothetical protein